MAVLNSNIANEASIPSSSSNSAYLGSNITNQTTMKSAELDAIKELTAELNYSTYGTSGTSDYNMLENKPSINNIVLQGNILSSQLGLEPGIEDAPADDKTYGRKNSSWVEITSSGGGSGIPDAPSDGKVYARQNQQWIETTSRNEVYTKTQADSTFLPKTTEIPTKTSQLTNDSGFITSIPDEYVTNTEMTEYAQPKGDYATTSYVDEKIGDINSILDTINGEVV